VNPTRAARPVPVPGSEFLVACDTVIIAIGNDPNPLIPQTTPGIRTTKWGNIVVDPESQRTSIPGVFAGGDIVLGAATVILAMGRGPARRRRHPSIPAGPRVVRGAGAVGCSRCGASELTPASVPHG